MYYFRCKLRLWCLGYIADSIFELLRKIILRGGIGPVIPAIIFLFFFFALPLVVLCAFGFVSIDRGVVDWTSISLDHLTSTIKDTLFWHFWWRSFWVGTVSTILCLCLGYPVAYIYTLAGRGWQILILVATISPLLTSALVRTYAWMVILGGRRGVVNSILLDLDFIDRPIRFLYSDFSVILGMTQIHLPFMILPLITVLSARDFSLEQASLNLGASRLKTFFKIIVPISLPGIIAGFALGMQSTLIPVLVVSTGVYISFELAEFYGVAIAAVGMLSTLGITLATDAYGPVADNAGGGDSSGGDYGDDDGGDDSGVTQPPPDDDDQGFA